MNEKDPVAFLSYVRSDDDHDGGRITELRVRLQGEIKMLTGYNFNIFQDRNDISWGQQWKRRIDNALMDVTFLIPVVTPSFFHSHACRDEFETFLLREKQIGENQLILPIYYVSVDRIEEPDFSGDNIVTVLKSRNWSDWRDFRFEPLTEPKLRAAVSQLAGDIVKAMKRLDSVIKSTQNISLHTVSDKKNDSFKLAKSIEVEKPIKGQTLSSVASLKPHSIIEATRQDTYKIYTNKFDEIIQASELLDSTSALSLHSNLLDSIRYESKIQSYEIAAFSKLIGDNHAASDVCLTLLIDNSGSLKGAPARKIATWTSIASRLISEAGIPNEVLGFTTRAWKGGQSRELWLSSGKTKSPGRLNDLRHIIYKSFDQTFQEADLGFSTMLKEGLLKENIDGEALQWASSRMIERSEKRKLLVVISDGAPVDDSTLDVNSADFLESHLIFTLAKLRSLGNFEVIGFGLNHDVSKYYGISPISNSTHFGGDLLNVLSALISGKKEPITLIQRLTDKEEKSRK